MMLWAIIAYRSIQLSMIVELLLIEAEFLAELIRVLTAGVFDF